MLMRNLSQTQLALGCEVSLTIVTDIALNQAETVFSELWRQVFKFERQFSRFLPKSELTIFNRSAGIKTKITTEFREILLCAQRMGTETGGLYNPFIMPALQRAGYTKSAMPGYEHDAVIDYSSRQVVGVERLIVGDDWAQIPYGTALDLGGCGKGFIADQIIKVFINQDIQGYWLSFGGDIVTGGVDKNGGKITINIQSAEKLDQVSNWMVECPSRQYGVATSGTFRRNNQVAKKNWHHIINPVTQEPAITDIRLVTVCADTSLMADVLASSAVILGSNKGLDFLKEHGAKAALLQCIDNQGKVFEKVFGSAIKIKTRTQLMEGSANA